MSKTFFNKRIPEPKSMGAVESKVFETMTLENYNRWIIPLVDHALNFFTSRKGKILDVGSGPGLLSKELATRLKKSEIIGIDVSRDAIRIAKNNCKKLTNAKFIQSSVESLPFKDGYFDFVITKDSFHHFPNGSKALKEMIRVLKPGGVLYIQDLKRDLPFKLLKRAMPPDNIMKKLQYYSARASYTIPEIKNLLKKIKIRKFLVKTRILEKALEKKYRTLGIDLDRLKESFITRYYVIVNKN
ncbi:MAG TPA: class I SAM-dependent methyltransferase [Candidatus Binatia bacterium]|nr:class I SAM-dependent methyltransferase [Candidatus Binatia bacterium]